MKTPPRIGVTLTALAGILLLTPAAAIADTPSGDQFGQHVRTCAQMGLSGSDNPGMHQGFAGWDGMACDG